MLLPETDLIILELTTRWLLAILFFFQAYDRMFRIGLKATIDIFYYQNTEQKIPYFIIKAGVYINSYLEFISGILLFTGIFRDIALYLLCLDMLVAAFGFSFSKPMWDMKHFFPRFILLCIQLFLPPYAYVLGIEKLF